MDEKLPPPPQEEHGTPADKVNMSRRTLLMNIGIALNAAVGIAIATPVVAYLLGPVLRKKDYRRWIPIGSVNSFTPGETQLVTFLNPFTNSWDGDTDKVPAYVRRAENGEFTVFAINCAHLGCPVRWFKESQLFMCPCHGGVYYADGSRASGPPERGLFTYDMKVVSGQLMINAGQMPTLSNQASATPCPSSNAPATEDAKLVTRISPCPGTNEPTIG